MINNSKICGFDIEKENIKDYYLYNLFDIDLKTAIDFFFHSISSDDNNFCIKPVEWAIKKLQEFKNNWFKIYVITARQNEFE